jgi:hypothetical protein
MSWDRVRPGFLGHSNRGIGFNRLVNYRIHVVVGANVGTATKPAHFVAFTVPFR